MVFGAGDDSRLARLLLLDVAEGSLASRFPLNHPLHVFRRPMLSDSAASASASFPPANSTCDEIKTASLGVLTSSPLDVEDAEETSL